MTVSPVPVRIDQGPFEVRWRTYDDGTSAAQVTVGGRPAVIVARREEIVLGFATQAEAAAFLDIGDFRTHDNDHEAFYPRTTLEWHPKG